MTDFKGINPDNNLSAKLNAKRQGSKPTPDHSAAQGDASQGDPYAELKMPPARMLDLLAAQARLNVPSQIENVGIERAMEAFSQQIPPDRHAQVSQLMQQTFVNEFGSEPSPTVLQNLVDDYLIGSVGVQTE